MRKGVGGRKEERGKRLIDFLSQDSDSVDLNRTVFKNFHNWW